MDRLGELRALYKGKEVKRGIARYREMEREGPMDPEAHLIGARLLRQSNDMWGAMRALELAKARGASGVILGQVLFTRGYLLREMGAPGEAIEQLNECLNRFGEYTDLGGELLGPLWYNLGLAYRQARQPAAAIDAYQQAAVYFRGAGMTTYLAMCLHNLAWVCCINGSAGDAEDALTEAEPLCTTDDLGYHQTMGRAFLAAIRPDRNLVHVMDACGVLLEQTDQLPADVASHACWLAGKVALELDLLDKALDLADMAIHYAMCYQGESRCLHDSAELRRDVVIALGLVPKTTGS